MKIAVTGADGYIGARVVKQLCDFGVTVVAADLCGTHIDPRAEWIAADLFAGEENWFERLGRPDACLHLAWRDGFVHDSPRHMGDLSAHFRFLANLIDGGIARIAAMGSMHEVGYFEGAIDETTPCDPRTQYGIAKNALRKATELYAEKRNCKFQWLRGFYLYGDDAYGNSIFCKLRQAVAAGETTFPFTDGKNRYDFLPVEELARQIALCVMQERVLGTINCCSGKPVSLAEQVEWYIRRYRLPIRLDYGRYPSRPYDSPCLYGDDRKIKEILRDAAH